MEPSFAIFWYNALRYLSGHEGGLEDRLIRPGDPVEIPLPDGTQEIRITRPDGKMEQLPALEQRSLHYGGTDVVGLYRAEPQPDRGAEPLLYPVNLFSTGESHIAPNAGLKLGREKVGTIESVRTVNEPIWPWLLAAAFAVMLIEWYVYTRRVYV